MAVFDRHVRSTSIADDIGAPRKWSEVGNVWTAPGWQELFSREQQVVGAAMCSAC
jgi:hypothetical protein